MYDVVIETAPQPGSERASKSADEQLLGHVEAQRNALAEHLSRRAELRLGPAYVVELGAPHIGHSVHLPVLLKTRYPIRQTAAAIAAARRFVGEIELGLAQALAASLGEAPSVIVTLNEASLPEADSKPESKGSWDRTAPVLGAIATGIGVIGFVTFVGGAIAWARYGAAGVPQEQALSVTPTQDLIVAGARVLVPAIALGLAGIVLYLAVRTGLDILKARRPRTADRLDRHADLVRGLYFGPFVAAVGALGFSVTVNDLDSEQFIALFIGGSGVAFVSFYVAWQTDRFLYLAGTIFLSLSLLYAGIQYVREGSSPRLRGAAVIQENKKAVVGFFVAEGANRVYLARVDVSDLNADDKISDDASRLVGFQRTEISDLTVGPPRPPQPAFAQAEDIADELCDLQLPVEPTASDEAQATGAKHKAKPVKCYSRPPGVAE